MGRLAPPGMPKTVSTPSLTRALSSNSAPVVPGARLATAVWRLVRSIVAVTVTRSLRSVRAVGLADGRRHCGVGRQPAQRSLGINLALTGHPVAAGLVQLNVIGKLVGAACALGSLGLEGHGTTPRWG